MAGRQGAATTAVFFTGVSGSGEEVMPTGVTVGSTRCVVRLASGTMSGPMVAGAEDGFSARGVSRPG